MDARVLAGIRSRVQFLLAYPDALATERLLDPRTVETPALRLITDALTRTLTTPDGRLIVSMPPQEGKTQLVRSAVVHRLATRPDDRIVYASYGISLARKHGRWIRDQVRAHTQILGVYPRYGHSSVADWGLEGHRGGVLSVGIGTGLTGNPAEVAIIDDPIKDREEADSLTYRDKVWNWWTDVLSTRLAPGAPVVVILTRWHEDDLAGRLVSSQPQRWETLTIPAQCDDVSTDPLGRQPGDWMTSARGRTPQQWQQIKTNAGARTWQALYQGRPSPAEGGLLRRDWWRRFEPPRWVTDANGCHWVPQGDLLQSWDLSFKGSATSDFVVGQIWQKVGGQFFLLDQVRGRWGFAETVTQIKNLTRRWPQALTKLVEDKANGPAVIDSLGGTITGLIPVNPQGGKVARANAVSSLIEAGNVHLPSASPWVDDLIEEAAAFPNGANDDQVDALTQALTRLALTQTHAGTGFFNIG